MKKQLSALAAALTLTTALAGPTFAGDPSQWNARKVNEYEGQHFARKVNEYEGQHRGIAPGFAKKGSFDITESEDQSNG